MSATSMAVPRARRSGLSGRLAVRRSSWDDVSASGVATRRTSCGDDGSVFGVAVGRAPAA